MRIYTKRQIARVIARSDEIQKTIKIGQSALSTYIQVLEFVESDINKYFKLGSGISARQTMRRMLDFTTLNLKTLRKLDEEYKTLEVKDE